MNKISSLGLFAGVRCRALDRAYGFSARHLSRSGLTSIRFAMVFGCLFAFAWLCLLSVGANAAVDSTSRSLNNASRLQAWELTFAAPMFLGLAAWCWSRAALRQRTGREKHAANRGSNLREIVDTTEAAEVRETTAGVAIAVRESAVVVAGTAANANAPFEPFEPRYLEALSEEGIDLHAFLAGWCRVMNDDLLHLDALRRGGELDRLHGVLHRLSGAVGLVGARSLMEALRHSSVSSQPCSASSIDVLTARARTLIMQLEAASHAFRSTLR